MALGRAAPDAATTPNTDRIAKPTLSDPKRDLCIATDLNAFQWLTKQQSCCYCRAHDNNTVVVIMGVRV